MSKINCTFNGEKVFYQDNHSISQLIEIEHISCPELAIVSINEKEIPRNKYNDTYIHNNDVIRIIYFLGDS